MSFRRAWSRFGRLPRTWGLSPGAREEWHQGRRWYHVWVLEIADPRVIQRRDEVAAALGQWVEPFCVDHPHVTAWVHGFSPPPHHPAEGVEIEVVVGRANAFASCPFLEVRAPGLAALRAAFCTPEERWAAYLPHLTIGRFSGPHAGMGPRIRPFRRLAPLRTTGRFVHRCVDAFDEGGRLVSPPTPPAETPRDR